MSKLITKKEINLNSPLTLSYNIDTPINNQKIGVYTKDFKSNSDFRGCYIRISRETHKDSINISELPKRYFGRLLTIFEGKVYQELPVSLYDRSKYTDVITKDGVLYKGADDIFEIRGDKIHLIDNPDNIVFELVRCENESEIIEKTFLMRDGVNLEDDETISDIFDSIRIRWVVSNQGKSISAAYWNKSKYVTLYTFNFISELSDQVKLIVDDIHGINKCTCITLRINQ